MYSSYYMEAFPFEVRKAEARRIITKHPHAVPVIIERAPHVPMAEVKTQYIMPRNLTLENLYAYVRVILKLEEEENLVLHVNQVLPDLANMMGSIYEAFRHDDYFLYVAYSNGTVDPDKIKLVDRKAVKGPGR